MRTLEAALAAHPFPFELTQIQKEDAHKLAHWGRALGDLPVGSGKTAIATAVALMLEPDTTLILIPPILIAQWEVWLSCITGKGSVLAYAGTPRERANMELRGYQWILTSYVIFKNDYGRFTTELKRSEVFTVVDEAHNLKSSASLIFKRVKDFSLGRNLLLMTGTPMSKPDDGYAYVKLNTPEVYRSLHQFENVHVKKRDIWGSVIEWQNLDTLQSNLGLRRAQRTKEEVHKDLPKARYIPMYYDLSPEHMRLYQRLMDEQLLELENSGGKIDATTSQTLQHCAQQIITNFAYFADDEKKRANVFDVLDEICEEIELGKPGSSKFMLWTQYRMTSRRVLAYMNQKTLAVGAYGEVNSKEGIRRFMEEPEVTTLVAQPGSAGAGLNPQHLSWEAFFLETPTTTIPFIQAAGRIDRTGQKYNPNIRLAVARGTVQETLMRKLIKNDKLVSQVTDNGRNLRAMLFPGS